MRLDLIEVALWTVLIVGLTALVVVALNAVGDTKFERTCPKQSQDGLTLAYATYEGHRLTCTYVPHTRGMARYTKEQS